MKMHFKHAKQHSKLHLATHFKFVQELLLSSTIANRIV